MRDSAALSLDITPPVGQHSVLTGRTGSGKTTTAIAIVSAICHEYPVYVIDTKGVEDFEELPGLIYQDPHGVLNDEESKVIIYRPEREHNEPKALDAFLDDLYFQVPRDSYVYIDEVYQVTEGYARQGRGFGNLLMRGRHHRPPGSTRSVHTSVICGTQRPSWVPRITFTEALHFYIHALSDRDLHNMVGEYGLPEEVEERPPEGHNFWYYGIGQDTLKYCHVNLEEEAAA